MKATIRRVLGSLMAVGVVVLAADVLADGTYDLRFWNGAGGGGVSSSGAVELSSTIAQPLAGRSTNGTLVLESGFWHAVTGGVSPVVDNPGDLPVASRLNEPYPNPFNPSTNVSFELAAPGMVRVKIFDARGQVVRDLVRESLPAGRHVMRWDGKTDQGANASSGVYFLRFESGQTVGTKKMTLLK
jgi:hypothetical protein